MIDNAGNQIAQPIYKEIAPFDENGLAFASRDGKYGYLSYMGDEIIPVQYDEISNFIDGVARVSKNGRYGFVNTLGQEFITTIYDSATAFSNGLAVVESNGRFGIVDIQGRTVVPCNYESREDAIRAFENLTVVKSSSKKDRNDDGASTRKAGTGK